MSRPVWITRFVAASFALSLLNLPLLQPTFAGDSCECNSCCEQCGGKKQSKFRPAAAPRGGIVQTMNARISEQPVDRSKDEDRVKKLEKEMEEVALQLKLISASIKALQETKASKQ